MAVYQCPVRGCTSVSSDESTSWHEFPTEEKRRHDWMTATRVKDCQKICSYHFKQSDFSSLERKDSAIPSRFPWTDEWLTMATNPKTVTKQEASKSCAVNQIEPNQLSTVSVKSDQNQINISKLFHGTIFDPATDAKRKDVHVIDDYIKGHSCKLDFIMEILDKFIGDESCLFTSTPESLKSNPSIMEHFRKPYTLNQDYPLIIDTPKIEGLEILNVFHGKPKEKNLPPKGELKRSPLVVGSKILVLKTSNLLGIWVKGTVMLINDLGSNEKSYKVKSSGTVLHKPYNIKHMAYDKPPDVLIPVGTRVVARYRPEDSGMRPCMYAGITVEPPKLTNKYRYLVFFDDGYAQYIEHDDICVCCHQSADVSEDIHPGMKDFIKSYLRQYPERPMVKLQKNQFIKTEWNSKWWQARVLEVDGSMVKMLFEADQRVEWIYRGSTRLGLLYKELANAEANRLSGKHRRHNIEQKKPNQPYVEYTRENTQQSDPNVVVIDSDEDTEEVVSTTSCARRKTGGGQYVTKARNTARKSTATTKVISNEIPFGDLPDRKSHQGYKEFHTITNFNRRSYSSHVCSPQCIDPEAEKKVLYSKIRREKSPFVIPVFLGFERQIRRTRKNANPLILYRSPCGRHLRTISEVYKYLMIVKSILPIDFFTFHMYVFIFRIFRPQVEHYRDEDITMGKENVPISVVNSLSEEPPPYVEYESKRFPGDGVNLNLDEEFLCGCTCTDNCSNPDTCECIQLTIKAYSKDGDFKNIGYDHRRLKDTVVTGIYECNSRCNCNQQCLNRVVQNGIQVRLQMFKTKKKGWGIRCLDDIDPGMFICIYAGQLLTDQGADEDGFQYGDEYMAELDHIEVCEKMKHGYESDVSDFDMDMEVESKNEKQADTTKEEEEESETSDSEINVCVDSDSDFDSAPPLRSTAMHNTSYVTRSKGKNQNSSKSPMLAEKVSVLTLEDSSNSLISEKEDTELPDLDESFSPFKSRSISLRPLSPTSTQLVDQIELGRNPKRNKTQDDPIPVAAKKSISKKHALSLPVPAPKKPKFTSIRSFYDEDSCYIMDAKSKGNIGRYLNHSCHPNVFVQNVFIDSHDLRFPTIAFFSINYIDAGTELTWDYKYEVNSVEGKIMYCYCDTRKCRKRLL